MALKVQNFWHFYDIIKKLCLPIIYAIINMGILFELLRQNIKTCLVINALFHSEKK